MIVADVNPLIYAFRPGAPFHDLARTSLTFARDAGALVVLTDVAASFVRISTDPRVPVGTKTPLKALEFLDAVTGSGRLVREGRVTRWPKFTQLVAAHALQGRDVPDGLLAATCLDLDAAILTADKGFLKYPGLRVNLLTPIGIVEHTSWTDGL